jgi:phage shock protein A
MVFSRFWTAMRAQFNKLANVFWEADPIAQMRYEYDLAVEELKGGRAGLEQYRGLVESVMRGVQETERKHKQLEVQVKTYLKVGDRETAKRIVVEYNLVGQRLEAQRAKLAEHEEAYGNCLKKVQHAGRKLAEVKEKIQQYDAELKMSEAEAELAKLTESFRFHGVSDFNQLEDVVQRRIDMNRGKATAAMDLSREGLASIEAEEAVEDMMAEDALKNFEVEMLEEVVEASEKQPERA